MTLATTLCLVAMVTAMYYMYTPQKYCNTNLIPTLHSLCIDVAHDSHTVDLRVEVLVVDRLLVVHKVGVKVQRQHLHWMYTKQ